MSHMVRLRGLRSDVDERMDVWNGNRRKLKKKINILASGKQTIMYHLHCVVVYY